LAQLVPSIAAASSNLMVSASADEQTRIGNTSNTERLKFIGPSRIVQTLIAEPRENARGVGESLQYPRSAET
jgi:hypothetical protein